MLVQIGEKVWVRAEDIRLLYSNAVTGYTHFLIFGETDDRSTDWSIERVVLQLNGWSK